MILVASYAKPLALVVELEEVVELVAVFHRGETLDWSMAWAVLGKCNLCL